MSLLRFLGLTSSARADDERAETASVRKIVDTLDRMPADTARRLARFAYVLGRVARADLAIDADEVRAMERFVMEHGHLSEAEAVLVVQIAKTQNLLFGETDGYLVTRAFAAAATRDEKLGLLECCFAVAATNDEISPEEEAELRLVANELGLEHGDFITARAAHREAVPHLRRVRSGKE